MKNKYEMENDAYQLGDIVRSIQVAQGKEAWDYFWRDARFQREWVSGAEESHYFSSKEAAKRGISRLVKIMPEAWEGTEFIVAKIEVR